MNLELSTLVVEETFGVENLLLKRMDRVQANFWYAWDCHERPCDIDGLQQIWRWIPWTETAIAMRSCRTIYPWSCRFVTLKRSDRDLWCRDQVLTYYSTDTTAACSWDWSRCHSRSAKNGVDGVCADPKKMLPAVKFELTHRDVILRSSHHGLLLLSPLDNDDDLDLSLIWIDR